MICMTMGRYRNAREWQKREENEKMERMKRLEEEKEARKLQVSDEIYACCMWSM